MTYVTSEDDQDFIVVDVFQGESELVSGNNKVTGLRVTGRFVGGLGSEFIRFQLISHRYCTHRHWSTCYTTFSIFLISVFSKCLHL